MLVSLNWISEYITLPSGLTKEQLAYDLTMRTVEVEHITDLGEALQHIVAGTITEVSPHPEADRLRITKVDIGETEPVQIVCGGSNLNVGQSIVAALPGAQVTWHGEGEPVTIKKSKLRGQDSYGMICGASEVMGLDLLFPAQEHEIMDISEFKAKPGTPIAQVLGLNDWILEIDNKSMTNRPDLWGHYGIARELSAIYKTELAPLEDYVIPPDLPPFPIDIQSPECLRYSATAITGLNVQDSPFDLKVKLFKVGLRPINLLVDLTNITMLLTGQPSHAFDLSKVKGGIQVRPASQGEGLRLLDDEELTLTTQDLVIASGEKALALAGVMGGKDDSIGPDTKEILLEGATFAPQGIRKTAGRYGLRTDSSMRFEKGLNTQRVDEMTGVFLANLFKFYPSARLIAHSNLTALETTQEVVTLSKDFLTRRLGKELTAEEIIRELNRLGFETRIEGEDFVVTAPSWRSTGDISLPEDILEEVARLIGYENFEFTPPVVQLSRAVSQKDKSLDRHFREYLALGCGLQEVFTYPWIEDRYIKLAGQNPKDLLQLADPPAPNEAALRKNLIPGLLEIIEKNIRHYDEFGVFEVTPVFHPEKVYSPSAQDEVLPYQNKEAAFALVGKDPLQLFRQAKGILEELPRRTMVKGIDFEQIEKPAWADVNLWLNIKSQNQVIGSLGLLAMKGKTELGLKNQQAFLVQLDLSSLVPLASRDNQFEPLPEFPMVEKDLSMLIDDEVTFESIEKTIAKKVKSVQFVDEYRGPQTPKGQKSVTIRVLFGRPDKTLSAQEIEETMNGISKRLKDQLAATIRDH